MIVRSKFRYTIYLAALASAILIAGHSAAQQATPGAGEFVTPDPADCTVEPRSLESMLAITGTPPADLRTPVSIATPGLQVPAGEPADPARVATVTATIHEMTACENAASFLGRAAFFTDNVLWYFESLQPLTPEQKTAMFGGTPVPRPPDERISIRVGAVQILPDGNVTAVVERRVPGGTASIVYVLVRDGDRYLIDHALDEHFEPLGTPPA